LQMNKTAMISGQRAYVSVAGGNLSYVGDSIHYEFVVKNEGNTPASSILVKYLVSTEDGGVFYVANSENILDIGPRDARTYSGQVKRAKSLPTKVIALAFYRDVFGIGRN